MAKSDVVKSLPASSCIPKVLVTAREIAEIDPFLPVRCFPEGITADNLDRFLLEDGPLSLLVEECDSLDIKVLCRERARELEIPVIMDTSDRGMLDVERFDLEPGRSLFHGWADLPSSTELAGLTAESKIPLILSILRGDTLSTRLRASLLEIGKSLTTWPQLASSVALGGAVAGDVCRRILLGTRVPSGRYYVDLLGWEALRRQRRRILFVILLVIALGALFLAGQFPPGARLQR